MKLRFHFLASLAMAAGVCAAQQNSAPPAGPAQPAVEAPAPKAPSVAGEAVPVETPAGTKSYVIGPLDVLDIHIWNDPKLTGIYNVRPDGILSMPLMGEMKADGLTPAELTKLISSKLTAFMNTAPDVNIQLAKNNSKKFYIMGEVQRPGEFPLTTDTTALDAFANAGGFRDFANQKKIYILRGDKKLYFNYKDVSQGKHMEQNIMLQSGDRIIVP